MARNWISLPRIEGEASRQAHADLPEGSFERELGKEGFFGPATQMYHRHPPTAWIDWEGPLRPRAFDLNRIDVERDSPWAAHEILFNRHVRCRFWQTKGEMPILARNGDGDDLLFVHQGQGDFFCDFGHLRIEPGDYILVPRGTMWRTAFEDKARLLLIEATNDSYMLPDKGLLGPHAIFDPAILDTPKMDDIFRAQQTPDGREDTWQVHIKRLDKVSIVTYAFNPLDAIGWHGNLTPLRINVRDIRPLMSHRYHLPPSAHTTFLAGRFVICTFVPRPFETDPGALKVPFFHNNDDFDEVIFYHRGEFFSRDNIDCGMVTFHPCGFTHGPHPKALTRAFEQPEKATNEVAVMLDTRDALEIAALPEGVENPDYIKSWSDQSEAKT